MKQILAGKKQVFEKREVSMIQAPRFRELKVKNVLENISGLVSVQSFLPDDLTEKSVERDFLYNVSLNFTLFKLYSL